MEVPRRLYYPVEYNPRVDNRQAEYVQRRRSEESRRRRWQREALEEQYEVDFRESELRGRR